MGIGVSKRGTAVADNYLHGINNVLVYCIVLCFHNMKPLNLKREHKMHQNNEYPKSHFLRIFKRTNIIGNCQALI